TTTWSAGRRWPEEVTTPVTLPPEPYISVTDSLNRNTTPCSLCRSANIPPSSGPSCRFSATGSGSTTVTSQPACLAAAVTSSPIHPPPTVTTWPPPLSTAFGRSLPPPGRGYTTRSGSAPGALGGRGNARVDSSSRSWATVPPSSRDTCLAPGSSAVTRTPSRRSTPFFAYQDSSC